MGVDSAMIPAAGAPYSIGGPTRRCAATDRELSTGEAYIAVLAQPAGSDDFLRLDYCAKAWDAGAKPDRSCTVLGFWRSTVPEPGARKRLLIDDQSLLELFEQSGEELGSEGEDGAGEGGRKQKAAFRFVLGLILLRKRLLMQEGSRGKTGRTLLVRPRGVPKPPPAGDGPPLVELVDPGLDEATIVQVTMQLGAVIDGGGGVGGTGGPGGPSGDTVGGSPSVKEGGR